jgi:hypothetical protein
MPKGWSKSVNQRRTDNTMAKANRTNYDEQYIHIKKLNIEKHELH